MHPWRSLPSYYESETYKKAISDLRTVMATSNVDLADSADPEKNPSNLPNPPNPCSIVNPIPETNLTAAAFPL